MQAEQKLEQFQAGLQNELDWLKRVEEKVDDKVWRGRTDDAEKVMEELTVSYKVCPSFYSFYISPVV